ncbi:MAG: Stk1 family PASTA domain-containing Ser/Thr kinase [Bacilli bacterium]|nr:Stk1 family PASTA domain-containing Ser/Thr kinase [Bacilli bacterium]
MIIKGQKINDRYQIIRMIGEGGMANVYLAYDTILDRNVAVKVLRGDLAGDEKFVRRFQREAISASSLSHPNIVEMYDVGEDDGKYFIVMEYIEGKTLKNLIKKRGSLTVPETIDIMMQLTSGIAHAHDSYIIHRDIKPQNVLILDDGLVKITDFGIAMALNSNELTQTNSVMGSVHYLPPEQASGNGSTIKSDIYSLGILMYELLTGKVPFKGDNAVEIAIKHMREPMPSVCSVNPDIPQSVENIILKACAKNPKNRYDNVREMHEDLKTALAPAHSFDRRLVYKYQENELEETKQLPKIDEKLLTKETTSKTKDKGDKVLNRILIIMASICFLLFLGVGIFAIIYPKMAETPDVQIPDVSNLSVVEAESKLKKLGFEVNVETKSKSDNTIEEGNVIETSPIIGRTVKKGTEITLIVSSGPKGLTMENYVGKLYYEVEASLEANNMHVIVETKEVADATKYTENVIIEQDPKEGTLLEEGDTVTLYIADIITKYPDFVNEGWNVSDVETFSNKYNLTLVKEYRETSDYSAGTIISQSRAADSKVLSGTTLKIVIATEVSSGEVEDIVE